MSKKISTALKKLNAKVTKKLSTYETRAELGTVTPTIGSFAIVSQDETNNDETWMYKAERTVIPPMGSFSHTYTFSGITAAASDLVTIGGRYFIDDSYVVLGSMPWEDWCVYDNEENAYEETFTDNDRVQQYKMWVVGITLTVKCVVPENTNGDVKYTESSTPDIDDFDTAWISATSTVTSPIVIGSPIYSMNWVEQIGMGGVSEAFVRSAIDTAIGDLEPLVQKLTTEGYIQP